MNIIFHVQGSLRKNGERDFNYYGGKNIARHFEDTLSFNDHRHASCEFLGKSGTQPVLQGEVHDILCELEDKWNFYCLVKATERSKIGAPMEIYVLSSYGKENGVSSTRVNLGSITPVKSSETNIVLTPPIVECFSRISRKRPRSSSVVRKLNEDTVVRSQDCPSQILFD